MTATGARSPAADPALVARFKDALGRLWQGGGKIGLAVSGGPDSMAILLLAEVAIPGQFEVATVDHGLRPASVNECAMVAEVCAARGIPCAVLTVEVGAGNLQEQARIARYIALEDWAVARGLRAIATAHHADDQAETLLMRLARGSGLSGLSGIRERRDLGGVLLIRPLLGWLRTELAAIVADVDTVADPSNSDPRHDRTHVRALLKAAGGRIDPLRIAASAGHLAAAAAALDWVTDEAIRSRVERSGQGAIAADLEGLPREIRRRILARLIGDADSPVDGPTLETAMTRLDEGQIASVGGLRLSPGNRVLIEKAPPRR